MIYFSAKDLLNRSCKQLKFFIDNPGAKPKPTCAQYDGLDYQHQIALSINNLIGEEMGNYIEFDNIRVYFSNDIVTASEIIEVKNINKDRPVAEYYRNNSILQSAVYYALTRECNRFLRTSAFHLNNGHDYKTVVLSEKYYNNLFAELSTKEIINKLKSDRYSFDGLNFIYGEFSLDSENVLGYVDALVGDLLEIIFGSKTPIGHPENSTVKSNSYLDFNPLKRA